MEQRGRDGYSKNLNQNVRAQAPAQAQVAAPAQGARSVMPTEVYIKVRSPANTKCSGKYSLSSDTSKTKWQCAARGMFLFSDPGGYWIIGDAELMRTGQGWFASHRPHNGTPPHDTSLRWAFVRKGGTQWENSAPITFSTTPSSASDSGDENLPRRAPAPAGSNTSLFQRIAKGSASVSLTDFKAALQSDAIAAEIGVPAKSARDYFYAITNGNPSMTETQLKVFLKLKDWIRHIDVRSTGYISAWDLEMALRKHSTLQSILGVQPHLAQSFMRQLDTEGNGRVRVVDFIKWCSATDAQRRPEHSGQNGGSRLIQAIESKHGKKANLTEGDVRAALSSDRGAQLELGWPEHQVPVIFKIVGCQGRISIAELQDFFRLTSLFNRIDSGRDGFIDAWEFGHALQLDPGLQADLQTSLSNAQKTFKEMDGGHQGTVSFLEFFNYFGHKQKRAPRPQQQNAQPAPRYNNPEEAYVTLKRLGEGSYGVVYLVNRKSDGLPLILKKPKMMPGFNMQDVKNEADLMRRMKHQHIVRFIEAFKDKQGAVVIVTEFCDGGDLRKKMFAHPRGLDQNTALTFFAQTLSALKYLHDRHIMHRDIKPDNIFLTSGGSVKLGDLGLAKQLRPSARGAVTHTVFRGPRGLPSYMAPEQHRGEEHSCAIDIWSLGCVLFEMSTGRVAFKSPEEGAAARGPPQGAPQYCSRLLSAAMVPDQYQRPNAGSILRMMGEHGKAVQDDGCMATYTRERRHREPRNNEVLMHPNKLF